MQYILEKNYKIVIGLILAFIASVSLLNAWWDTAIYDEMAHIPAGYTYVRYGDMRLNPEHPPLLKDLAGLPLLFMDLKFDLNQKFWKDDVNGQWDAGRHLLWQAGNNGDQIVFWSRVPFILLSLLLGWFIFKWTKELAGVVAGLFALTLYAFDPNMLGHNHFVTTDLGIAAFSVFSLYYFLQFIKEPTWKNVLLGGLFLGLLQLVKFSSVLLFPVMGLVLIAYPLLKQPKDKKVFIWRYKIKLLVEYLGKGILAFLVSIVLVWIVYIANTHNIPEAKLKQTIEFSFQRTDPNIKASTVNKALMPMTENALTRPMAEYLLGIAMVFKRVGGGNGAYFMNEVSIHAFPLYFPTVFILKETLPHLLLMLTAVIIALIGVGKSVVASWKLSAQEKSTYLAHYIRHNITSLTLLFFIFLYSYISITGNLNIGFRHLFPILPFIYILIAKVLFDRIKKIEYEYGRNLYYILLTVLTIFIVAETASAYPYYMSYFNQLAGGSKNGYRFVTDSNADWGQDMRRLKTWINDYNDYYSACQLTLSDPPLKKCTRSPLAEDEIQYGPIDKIRVDYFGGADIKYSLQDTAVIWWDSKRPIEPGWYAISTNFIQGSIYDKRKADNQSYRWLNQLKPVHQVGTSIIIYYLTPEQAAALN